KQMHPDCCFSLVLGSDIMKERDRWKEFNDIRKMAEIIYLNRSGFESNNPNNPEILFPDISSSDIRYRLQHGDNIVNLVPVKVVRYISKNKLYLTE
ncbi:MAG: hypothetical protein FJ088_05715, partial [Deltaproteobacteria bacterium]|nr:hypothetical protein [Deltaproteobacteria bacterium]